MTGQVRDAPERTARVSDAMTYGVITCPPGASLRTVARVMSTNHIHTVVLAGPRERPTRAVSQRQLLAGIAEDALDRPAGDAATTRMPTVQPGDPLLHAAAVMTRCGESHALVVDDVGAPAGILSSLDVAAAIGQGPRLATA